MDVREQFGVAIGGLLDVGFHGCGFLLMTFYLSFVEG
jgi:hypothetical protein